MDAVFVLEEAGGMGGQAIVQAGGGIGGSSAWRQHGVVPVCIGRVAAGGAFVTACGRWRAAAPARAHCQTVQGPLMWASCFRPWGCSRLLRDCVLGRPSQTARQTTAPCSPQPRGNSLQSGIRGTCCCTALRRCVHCVLAAHGMAVGASAQVSTCEWSGASVGPQSADAAVRALDASHARRSGIITWSRPGATCKPPDSNVHNRSHATTKPTVPCFPSSEELHPLAFCKLDARRMWEGAPWREVPGRARPRAGRGTWGSVVRHRR